LRRRLMSESQQMGTQALHERLAKVDAAAAKRLHPNDVRRIIRALEVVELTGRPLSDWQQQWKAEPLHKPSITNTESPPQVLWLDLPRAELYARIDERVQQMMETGLLEEVRRLRALPRPISREAAQALGYKELFAYLDGQTSLAEAVVRIQTRSRNFAKRQITWFRHLPNCRPVSRELTFTLWGSKMKR
jgi:tRNA dimethylallyltransferase